MSTEELFEEYIEDNIDLQTRMLKDLNKNTGAFTIEFGDLYNFDPDLGIEIIKRPTTMIDTLRILLWAKARTLYSNLTEDKKAFNVRVKSLPVDTGIRDIIKDAKVGTLVQVDGVIVKTRLPKPRLMRAAFVCSACSARTSVDQTSLFVLREPDRCDCRRRGAKWMIDTKSSTYVPEQWVVIQEKPEDLPAGQLPQGFRIYLTEDLVGRLEPGNRIKVVGILDVIPDKKDSNTMSPFIWGNSYTHNDEDEAQLGLTDDEISILKENASDYNIKFKIMDSIAPSIYGLDYVKEAITYLLFGGVGKALQDVNIRGDINILLVGDPGTAKSQLLNFAADVAPRGFVTTGRGSTAAGLTAAVVKDEGGMYSLEAGALVLADRGLCCIDEMDKMKDEDRQAMHPAMEQQKVPIAKAGIVTSLNSRCSVFAAANPVMGRYNPYKNINENINLPITLLNRFDIIFILRDIPNADTDRQMVHHILQMHVQDNKEPPYDTLMLKKYIHYARSLKPKLTQQALDKLEKYYIQMRAVYGKDENSVAIMITARQLESLVRIAEASARIRLSETVDAMDAQNAIDIVSKSMYQVGLDVETGQVDMDIVWTGKPKSFVDKLEAMKKLIAELYLTSGECLESILYEEAEKRFGLGSSETRKVLSTLDKDGIAYQPKPGLWRV